MTPGVLIATESLAAWRNQLHGLGLLLLGNEDGILVGHVPGPLQHEVTGHDDRDHRRRAHNREQRNLVVLPEVLHFPSPEVE